MPSASSERQGTENSIWHWTIFYNMKMCPLCKKKLSQATFLHIQFDNWSPRKCKRGCRFLSHMFSWVHVPITIPFLCPKSVSKPTALADHPLTHSQLKMWQRGGMGSEKPPPEWTAASFWVEFIVVLKFLIVDQFVAHFRPLDVFLLVRSL